MVITRYLPLPADQGAKQRTAALLARLADRFQLTVCGFDDGTADGDALRGIGATVGGRWPTAIPGRASGLARSRSLSASKCWSSDLFERLRRTVAARPADVVVLEFPQMGAYLRAVPDAPLVLALHNVESALAESWARTKPAALRPPFLTEAALLRRLERRLLRDADVVSVAGAPDVARLPRRRSDVLVCPNGIEPGAPLPDADSPGAAFIGHMSFPPNVDGAMWLATRVWPRVLAAVPDAELALVGGQPAAAVRRLASPTIRVTGRLHDVRPELQRARVALAPLRAGGGTRLKVLEALNAGRPVVATPIGAEGLESLAGKGLVIAEGPAAFAAAVSGLLQDPDLAARLGRAGNQAVRDFSWDRNLTPLVDRIRSAARG